MTTTLPVLNGRLRTRRYSYIPLIIRMLTSALVVSCFFFVCRGVSFCLFVGVFIVCLLRGLLFACLDVHLGVCLLWFFGWSQLGLLVKCAC